MRVLIVGAGPTGLTAAVELARRGLIAEIVERREAPSPLSRAVGITPRSLAILSPSGAAEAILREGAPLETARIHRGARLLFELPARSERAPFPHMIALPQDRTEAALLDALARHGGAVGWGRELAEAREEAGRVVARFADGGEAAYDLVLGADGVRSRVRDAAGIAFDGIDLPEEWSIADVEAAGWPHERAFAIFTGEAGEIAVVAPLGGGRYRVIADRPGALARLPLKIEATRVRAERSFRISVRQAARYEAGRLHLAGDAAHCHSPVGGRGMNLGISDAAAFAEALAAGRLAGWSAARHAEGKATIAMTERGRRLMTDPSGFGRARRRLVFAALAALPPLRRRLGRLAVEL